MKVRTILDSSFEGLLVDVECTITNGLPSIIIIGSANKAVDEARERIRGAFSASGLILPKKRITINLAPADVPKSAPSFDLAIALAILITSQIVPILPVKTLVIGELGLDGVVRPVRGILGKLLAGKKAGITNFFIPIGNTTQAKLIEGITVYPVGTLKQLYNHLTGVQLIEPLALNSSLESLHEEFATDFKEVIGQNQAKRALEIAAAGSHNILLSGPPGTGKSMLAKALISILPPMTHQEMIEVTHVHSLGSHDYEQLITERPFRSPHHSASDTSIIGGGKNPKPGEISLSHRGVLMLDEFPEFNRPTIEALRQPLEDRVVTVARAKETLEFPAHFILVATANPCPCGNYGSTKNCDCLPSQISRYQQKLSGPILDRIDLHVTVENVAHDQLLSETDAQNSSKAIRTRVIQARTQQAKRFGNTERTNSTLTNKELKLLVGLKAEAKELLDQAAEKLDISARAYMRTLKVARTIADLEGSLVILPIHVSEALQYRPQTPSKA